MIWVLCGGRPADLPAVRSLSYADGLWALARLNEEARRREEALEEHRR